MTKENKIDMTETVTITVPRYVSMKVCGVARIVDRTELHDDTQAFTSQYGMRRWYQDNGNSVAKALRDEGSAVDPEAIFNDRHAVAMSGELSTRASGGVQFTDEQEMVYEVASEARSLPGWSELATVWAACKGMTTSERKEAILECVESLDKKRKSAIHDNAAKRLEQLSDLIIE